MTGSQRVLNTYTVTGYSGDTGTNVYPIRISSIDLAAQPTADTGKTPTPGLSTAVINRSNKKRGVRPRYWRLSRTTGTPPTVVTHYKNFPLLLAADFNGAIPSPLTIGANTWTFIERVGESIK